jgi:hypothetical protein
MYARIPTVSVDNTVGRTVALKVIQDLKSNLNVFSKAFVALENIFSQDTFQSGVANISIDKNSLEIPIVEKLEAKIESRKLNGLTVGNFQNQGTNIFKTYGLSIDAEMVNTELNISLEYKTKSKVNAGKLENMLKDHHITKGNGFYHNVFYYYNIPDDILGLMEDIVDTRKINHDDGKDIIDFIKSGNIQNMITLRSDVNGLEGDVGLAVISKSRIHGVFTVELSEVKPEYDRDANLWSIQLEYKVNYLSPESFLIDYEILHNNTMLDPDKYLMEKMDNPDTRRESDNLYPMQMYDNSYKFDYVAIPPFDNHKPLAFKSKTITPIMSVLCSITPDDKRSLFNLTELEYYDLSDSVLDYIKATKNYITKQAKFFYKSVFRLDIYKDDKLQFRDILEIDDDLNVFTNIDLDITGVYRCVLSIITDMKMIDVEYRSLVDDILDSNVLSIIYTGNVEKDFRVSDSNIAKMINPVKHSTMRTAQISTIQTFFKKGE